MTRPAHKPLPPKWPVIFAPSATHFTRKLWRRHSRSRKADRLAGDTHCCIPLPHHESVASEQPACVAQGQAGLDRAEAASRLLAAAMAVALSLTPAAQAYAQAFPVHQQPASLSRNREGAVADAARAWEDALNKAVRRLDVLAEQALDTVGSAARSVPAAFGLALSSPDSSGTAAEAKPATSAIARELILEVGDLVADHYLDAREGGFNKDKWRGMIREALQKSLPDANAAYRSIRQLLVDGVGDPYTRFITPQQFEAMGVYDVTGVGMNLGSTDEYSRKVGFDRPVADLDQQGIWVLATVKGSAAEKAGVRQGDEVVAINGDALQGQSAYQAAALIQQFSQPPDSTAGTASTRVTLTVRRPDSSDTAIPITRIAQPYRSPVTHQLVAEHDGGQVGMIKLSAFNARTKAEIADAVRDLESEGAKRLVLDLRNNLGGLFLEGVEVARLFLDGSTTLAVLEGQGRTRPEPLAAGGHALTQAPLTVLINERSASASEILAGALRDNCRAVLVGSRSYGKGLIQSVYQLDDGSALVLTVGKYLTPARTDIDRHGISPDFARLPSAADAKATLAACRLPSAA